MFLPRRDLVKPGVFEQVGEAAATAPSENVEARRVLQSLQECGAAPSITSSLSLAKPQERFLCLSQGSGQLLGYVWEQKLKNQPFRFG